MIETIPVARVLREAITTPYRILVTRATGAAVRDRIEVTLAQSGCRTALLDFSEVELLDLSCADEVVAKLLRVGRRPYVALVGLHHDLHDQVHEVLAPQELAVAVVDGGRPSLLGSVCADGRAAFEELCRGACDGAAALADRLDWSRERAAAALDGLAARRLVHHDDHGYAPLPLPLA
ncbi:MAG: hypothetical protein MUC69_06230 [Gemmatimonadales bacterium]|jgi:hypothetical protein|nr:hypothetical protein [Gemmatimonadales bacterium]